MKIAELYTEFRATGLNTMIGRMSTLRASLNRLDVQLAGVRRVARRAFMAAGAAMGYGVYEAIKFEKQLAMVSTMLDEQSMKYLPAYASGLRRLAKEYGESTSTLSKGLYDILSASIEPAKAMQVLEIATRAAGAGITDTAVSTDAITSLLNSYGLSAEHAAIVSDRLFAAVKRGKMTFPDLASNIGKVGATAAKAGLSMEELLASVATMTRAGIRAEESMAAMNGILRAFIKPTDEALQVAKQYGIELSSTALASKGLIGQMKKLNQLSTEELAMISPRIRGLKGLLAILGDAEGYTYDLRMQQHAAGMTTEAFAKMQNTLSFEVGRTKEEIIDLFRAVGNKLTPIIKQARVRIAEFTKHLEENWDTVVEATAKYLKWTAAISGTVFVLAKLPSVLAGGTMAAKGLLIAVKALMAHPLIALITAIAAVTLKMIGLERITDSLRKAFSWLSKTATKAWDAIKKAIDPVVKSVKLLFNEIWQLVQIVGKTLVQAFQQMGRTASKILGPIWTWVKAIGKAIIEYMVKSILLSVAALRHLSATWDVMKLSAQLALVTIWEEIKHTFTYRIPEVWAWLSRNWKDVLKTLVYNWIHFLNNIMENLRRLVVATVRKLMEIDWGAVWEGFKKAIIDLLKWVWSTFTSAIKQLVKFLADIDWSAAILSGMGAAMAGVATAIKLPAEQVKKTVDDIVGEDWKFDWVPLHEGLKNYIKEGLDLKPREITETEKRLKNQIREAARPILEEYRSLLDSIFGDGKERGVGVWGWMKSLGERAVKSIRDAMQGPLKDLWKWLKGWWDKLGFSGAAPGGGGAPTPKAPSSGEYKGLVEHYRALQSASLSTDSMERQQLVVAKGIHADTTAMRESLARADFGRGPVVTA